MTDTSEPRVPPADKATLGQLVERLTDQSSRLVRAEIALVKNELSTKAKFASVGIGLMAGGAVVVLYGIGYLFYAAMAGLNEALPLWLSALIVAVTLLLIAGILVFIGIKSLKRGTPPTPTTAVESIKQDVATVKEGLNR